MPWRPTAPGLPLVDPGKYLGDEPGRQISPIFPLGRRLRVERAPAPWPLAVGELKKLGANPLPE